MNGKKGIILNTIRFGFRGLINHVCLFAAVLLAGGVIGAAVVYLVYLFNADFIKAIFEAGALENVQLSNELVRTHVPTIIVSAIIPVLVFIGLYLGLNKIALELCDHDKSSVKKLFSCFRLVPRTFAALIVYAVAVIIGTICLIVPGIFIGVRCSLFPYFIIDQNAGVIESLKMSYDATKNYGWTLFLLGIVVSILTSLPKLLVLLLGPIGSFSYLLTIPFSALVYAFFYYSLVYRQNNRLSDAS